MQKKTLFFILFFCCTLSIYAQPKKNIDKIFKFGKVDVQEFETKVSGPDSAARGVKLFDVGKCWFEVSRKTGSFVYIFERHIRYKVLNKTGFDLADFDVQLYKATNNSAESLVFMNAATYNLENNQVVVSKLSKDAKFSEKQDDNWTIKKFTLPNVKEGSIIEFRYRIESDFIFNLRDWYFQSSIPTLYSEYDLKIPEYLKYKISTTGYIPINQAKEEEINVDYYIHRSDKTGESIQGRGMELKYNAENVPAIKEEKYITTIEDYISKIEFELNATRFPGSIYKDYSSTWPKIIDELLENENFGKYFSRSSYSRALVASIVKEEKDPELQMQLIFDYVKGTLKWNDRFSKYTTTTNVKSIIEKKSGNSADLNLTLLSLLTEAKINASPILISTRENGAHPGYPQLSKFNNVIVLVEIGGKTHLLDASDKYLTKGLISYENLNHQGFKINTTDKTGDWISLEVIEPSRYSTYYNLVLTEDNKLTGSLFLSYNNYAGLNHRNKFNSATNEAEFIKGYKKDKPGLEISNFKIENLNSPSEFLSEVMNVVIEDNVEEAGNLILLSPLLFERTKENPFKLEERNFPVDFAHPIEETYRINIEFPKNYKLEKLPANGKLKLPNNEASFTYMFSTENNRLAIISKIFISKTIFNVEGYQNLKELFRNIVEKQAQQIVFKKI